MQKTNEFFELKEITLAKVDKLIKENYDFDLEDIQVIDNKTKDN